MPKISNKNQRFRTKEKLCDDIAFVLNSTLHYGTKFAVLSEATWVWTEFQGKYVGCEHWSETASELRTHPDRRRLLVHEHVIPKSIVIERLLGLPTPTGDSVDQLLASYCIGAVITREEDARLNGLGLRSKMPPGWDEKDAWARYKYAGIVLRTEVAQSTKIAADLPNL
jgi:hypothetical protein